MDSVKYWNSVFSKLRYIKPEYDLWLEKYKDILSLSHDFPIVDLGCGDGGNSLYLNNNGYQVISCDFSEEALNIVKLFIPKCIRLKFDFAKYFPFDDDSVKCIIADLSIHYFNKVVTMNIIDNMQRSLVNGGFLICRLDSNKNLCSDNINIEIEENFYKIDGIYKSFFNKEYIYKIFRKWNLIFCEEKKIYKYSKEKIIWEVVAKVKK